MPYILEIFRSLLTPVIGCVTVYIAYQQWQTNKRKFVFDRYDRRLRVYEEVRKILSIITRDATVSYEDLLKFRTSVSDADFLFGPEISNYIDEIYEHGMKLRLLTEKHNSKLKSEDFDSRKNAKEMSDELRWLMTQIKSAKQKFRKYLDISY